MTNVVAWRCSDVDKIRFDALKATFADPTMRSVFEWLFAQREVRDVIERRLESQSHPQTLMEVPREDEEERPDSVFAEIGYRS